MKKVFKYIIGVLLILLILNITGCTNFGIIRNNFGVYGTVNANNFNQIDLKIGELKPSLEYTDKGITLRNQGKKPVNDNLIAIWDTTKNSDGEKILRINVSDKNGNSNSEYAYFSVDNLFIRFFDEGSEIDVSSKIFDVNQNSQSQSEICNEDNQGECNSGSKQWCNNREWAFENYCSHCKEYFNTNDLDGCFGDILCSSTNNCVVLGGQNPKNSYKLDYTNLNLIDWQDNGIILEENNLKIETNNSVDIANLKIKTSFDILGYLYYSELPYNGNYQLRIRVYDNAGKLIDEDLSPAFSVKGLQKNIPTNQINNPADKLIEGYLKLWIEKQETGSWVEYQVLSNDNAKRTILNEGNLKLSKFAINQLTKENQIKINEPGNYKLKMQFVSLDNKINLNDEFEFEVSNEKKEIVQTKCEDGTERLECSSKRQFLCNNELKLVENCYACGCPEGMICQDNGKCI